MMEARKSVSSVLRWLDSRFLSHQQFRKRIGQFRPTKWFLQHRELLVSKIRLITSRSPTPSQFSRPSSPWAADSARTRLSKACRHASQGLPGDRQHGGERVLLAMVELVQEKMEAAFFPPVPRDIHARREVLNDIALVPNRADEDGRPENAPIFSIATNLRVTVASPRERGLDCHLGFRPGPKRDQETETLAKDLFTFISGQSKKTVIDEDNWIVRVLRIGKYYCHPCLFGGDDERAKIFLKTCDIRFGGFLFP